MDISLINQCIASLILESNKLVIPELGALLRKHLPDGKEKITFSTLLRYNDGILQKAVEEARDLTPEESSLALKLFVEQALKSIETKAGFVIPGVGVLRMDELKDIVLVDETASLPTRTIRTPRRIADIDIAEDTEAPVHLETEEEVRMAQAKARRLDDLQARLGMLNAAKETSIRHLRDDVQPDDSEPKVSQEISQDSPSVFKEAVEVILEPKRPTVPEQEIAHGQAEELGVKEEIEVVMYLSKSTGTKISQPTEEAVEAKVTEPIQAKEQALPQEQKAETSEVQSEVSGGVRGVQDEVLEASKPEIVIESDKASIPEDQEENIFLEDRFAREERYRRLLEEDKKRASRKLMIWLSTALVVCGLLITAFVKSDEIEKIWKGSALDRWFWSLVEPMGAKIDKVIVVNPEKKHDPVPPAAATSAAATAAPGNPGPTAAKPEVQKPQPKASANGEMVFEQGVYYVIAGSYSSKETANKGLAAYKNDPRLKLMSVDKGAVKYVLVAGRYDKREDAQAHLTEWEGSWVLYKPLKP